MNTFEILATLMLRVLPGVICIILFFILVKPDKNMRILVYIFTFVLFRDAMTPLGLWSIGSFDNIPWIRLSSDPLFLILFGGVFSSAFVFAFYQFDKENRVHLKWFRDNKIVGPIVGVLGCLVVVLPLFILYKGSNILLRGGIVSASLFLPILIFALVGNLLEETLFRGYVLGFLEDNKKQKPIMAGITSGVVFAFCHVFLAVTVTDVGAPLLVFTLWEGIIAGIVGAKYGIVPATLTHGGAIFLISSGLLG